MFFLVADVHYPMPASRYESLYRKIDAPVCDTLMGKGVFPGEDPAYTGMLGNAWNKDFEYWGIPIRLTHCNRYTFQRPCLW